MISKRSTQYRTFVKWYIEKGGERKALSIEAGLEYVILKIRLLSQYCLDHSHLQSNSLD